MPLPGGTPTLTAPTQVTEFVEEAFHDPLAGRQILQAHPLVR